MTTNDQLTAANAAIVTALQEAIAAGPGEWSMPWHRAFTIPTNAATGRQYSGGNIFVLWAAEQATGYPTSHWATYKQWETLGAQVRKGEKHTKGVRVQPLPPVSDEDAAAGKRRPPFTLRVFQLFNAAQVDGWQAPAMPDALPAEQRHAAADAWFAMIAADVRNGGGRAFYSPAGDYIGMPDWSVFHSPEAYYGVLAHEHIHWTGHSSREARTFGTRGSADYAREELVAELGAALVMAHLGMSVTPREDHAQYLAHWLGVINEDPKALWKAATAAQKATDRLVRLTTGVDGGNGDEDADD